ncbi:MAG: hypothetical protein JWN64_840 [Parcubacteria group bacterium]|nr:hypothetical protein [Parcubacteria group bacterium]
MAASSIQEERTAPTFVDIELPARENNHVLRESNNERNTYRQMDRGHESNKAESQRWFEYESPQHDQKPMPGSP